QAQAFGEQARDRAGRALSETLFEPSLIRAQALSTEIAGALDQDLRREHSGLHCRADALPTLRVGEPGRIANQHHAIAHDRASGMRVEKIGVALVPGGSIGGHFALRLQPAAERVYLLAQAMVALAAEPDIEKAALAEAPAVSLQILAEIELGPLRGDAAGFGLL